MVVCVVGEEAELLTSVLRTAYQNVAPPLFHEGSNPDETRPMKDPASVGHLANSKRRTASLTRIPAHHNHLFALFTPKIYFNCVYSFFRAQKKRGEPPFGLRSLHCRSRTERIAVATVCNSPVVPIKLNNP